MQNKFLLKLREDKGARAIAMTVCVMLLVLTLIIVTTVLANRTHENPTPSPDESQQAGISDPDTTPPEGEKPGDQKPTEAPTNALPTRFLLPVSGVMSKEHNNDLQSYSPTMQDYRTHAGIDIATIAGATVSAMADGVVAQIYEDVGLGYCVAVKHGGECYTYYKNLAPELAEGIAVGVSVKAGDAIGKVGESAMNEILEEPHLHLEMTVNGEFVDPTDYFDEDAMATLTEDTNYEDAS